MDKYLVDKLRQIKRVIPEADLSKVMPIIMAMNHEDLKDSVDVIDSSEVKLKSYLHVKILALDSEELKRRIDFAIEHGIIDKVKKYPLYILNKSVFAVKRTESSADEKKVEFSPMDPSLSANGGRTIDTARFDKLQTMTTCVNGVFEMLADENISKENVFPNLERNILSGEYLNDGDLLFHTITDGKGYSEDKLGKVKEAVQEVLKNIKER